MARRYLGDGAYVDADRGVLRLMTWDGERETNVIYLAPENWGVLVDFVDDLREGGVNGRAVTTPGADEGETETPPAFTFRYYGREVMRITPDRRLEPGPGLSEDEATRRMFEALVELFEERFGK